MQKWVEGKEKSFMSGRRTFCIVCTRVEMNCCARWWYPKISGLKFFVLLTTHQWQVISVLQRHAIAFGTIFIGLAFVLR
jgi:hypothetical protein